VQPLAVTVRNNICKSAHGQKGKYVVCRNSFSL